MYQKLLKVIALVIVIDQSSKFLVSHTDLTQLNTGFSLGIVSTSNQFFLVLTIIGIMIMLWLGLQQVWKQQPIIAGLFFGGGISNIIDRVIYGGVRDWLIIPGFELKNNLADWSISISLIALILVELWQQFGKKESNGHSNTI